MEITRDNIDALNAKLTVKVVEGDYKPAVDAALKDYRKNMTLPGFRPGNVPMTVVKKRVGKAVLAEEINKLLSESLHNYITENKLEVLGQPMPVESDVEEGDWDNPTEFTFNYEMGLAPEIEVKLDKVKETYYSIKVDDKMVDEEVKNLARRFGSLSEPEKSEDSDMLMGTFIQLTPEGEILEGGIMNDGTVSIEFVEDKKTKKALVGLEKGAEVDLDAAKVSRDQEDLSRMLGISAEEVAALPKGDFRFRVNEIRRLAPSEINQELFDKAFGEGNVEDEAGFRARIAENIENALKRDQDWYFKNQLSENLIEHFNPELPDAFLKRWIKATNEKPLTDEQLDTEYPGYAKSVKWQLIEERIARANDVKVEYPEMLDHVKANLAGQYAQYGLPLDEETLEKYAANALSNKEEVQRIFELIREEKVIASAKELIKLKEKSVSIDEFKKLVNPDAE